MRWALVFILIATLISLHAMAAEKQVGQPCNSDNSSTDWDTIAQCNGTTFIKAPLLLGAVASPPYSTTACDAAKAGMIQWTGASFQSCDGSSWSSLGGGSGSSILGTSATVTSPYRSGDLTTGLFSDTASTVSIATSGGARLTVTGTGNVGIGTTTPTTMLNVAQNNAIQVGQAYLSSGGNYVHLATNEWYNGSAWVQTATGGLLQITGTGTFTFYSHTATGGGHTALTKITSDGYVGIGTSSPGTLFHVYGNGSWTGGFRTEYSGGGGNGWNITDGSDNNLYIGYGSAASPASKVVINTTGTVSAATPTASNHLATKAYVDAAAAAHGSYRTVCSAYNSYCTPASCTSGDTALTGEQCTPGAATADGGGATQIYYICERWCLH